MGFVVERGADQVADGLEAGLAFDLPLAVAGLDELGLLLIVFVLDAADDLLDQILHRHQAGGAAVLVDNDRHVVLVALHLVEEFIGLLAEGDEAGGTEQFLQFKLFWLAGGDKLEQILDMEDPEDVVEIPLVDRQAGEFLAGDRLQGGGQGGVVGQGDDFGTVDHQLGDFGVVELQDVVDHRLLGGADHPFFLAFVDHHADFLLGDPFLVGFPRDAKDSGDQVGRKRQQMDKGRCQPRHQCQQGNHRHRDGIGILHGDPLRHQFAKDQREIGQHQRDRTNCQWIGNPRNAWNCRAQPCGGILGKALGGKGAGQESGESDPDLDGGEEPAGLLQQRRQQFGPDMPLAGHLAQLGVVERDDGDLGRRKEGVGQDQQAQNQQSRDNRFHKDIAFRRTVQGGMTISWHARMKARRNTSEG